jgi:uncharacterized membrane protein
MLIKILMAIGVIIGIIFFLGVFVGMQAQKKYTLRKIRNYYAEQKITNLRY